MSTNSNHYQLLGIGYNASFNEIRKAYRTLALRSHPDRMHTPQDKERGHHHMVLLNMAYKTLSNETSRREYDQSIGVSSTSQYHSYQQNYSESSHRSYSSTGSPFKSTYSTDKTYQEMDSDYESSPIYCPHCGQGQPSIDTEICIRCGKSVNYFSNNSAYANENNSSNSRGTMPKQTSAKKILIIALICGFLGFNGVGHITVGKKLLGIGLMILGWILVIISVNGVVLKLVYLFYLILQTADAYRRAKTAGR